MHRKPLRIKVMLSVGGIVMLVLGTSTWIHIRDLQAAHSEAIAWRAEALAQGIVNYVVSKLQYGDYDEDLVRGILKGATLQCIQLYDLYKDRDIAHIAVIDAGGTIVAHNAQEFWDTPAHPELQAHLARGNRHILALNATYHALIPMFGRHGDYLGAIDIGVPRRVTDQKITAVLTSSIGLSIVFLLFTFGAVAILINLLVTRPISHLIRIGRQIARGELVRTLPAAPAATAQDAGDEIGALTAVFRDMVVYLHDTADVATTIAAGDLRRTVTPRSDADALGMAFQRMSQYLNAMAAVAAAIADGDLRCAVQPGSDHDALGQAFYKMAALREAMSGIMAESEKMRAASQTLSHISVQMTADAEQTSQRVRVVSARSGQVTDNLHNVSTATEEMSATIREIARTAGDVMQVIIAAVDTAQAASATITELEARSQEIGTIVNVITTITQQTNLLALNATIEAARAGDSGRGFVVVAQEIKELSRKIANSADDIIRKIETMQSGASDAATEIARMSEGIRQVHDFSHAISSAVEEQAVTTDDISRNLGDASAGSDDVTQALADVAAVTEHTMERALSVQHAAEALAALSDQLQRLLGRFTLA